MPDTDMVRAIEVDPEMRIAPVQISDLCKTQAIVPAHPLKVVEDGVGTRKVVSKAREKGDAACPTQTKCLITSTPMEMASSAERNFGSSQKK